MRAILFDIRKFSINDGPGIRTTVFLKGCPLACAWCHNPESQSFQPEIMLWDSRCTSCGECVVHCPHSAIASIQGVDGALRFITRRDICTRCGACLDACVAQAREMVGRSMSVEEVLAAIERDRAFYEESGGGVTISGGEPLSHLPFLLALLQACREREIHTTVDTSGYCSWTALEAILPFTNLFLFDLKHLDDDAHRRWTGVSNTRILRNLHRLSDEGAKVILRVPVVPGVNDDLDHLARVAELAARLPAVQRVDLLPYHASAAGKYARLGRAYLLENTPSPAPEFMHAMTEIFQARGLVVQVGG